MALHPDFPKSPYALLDPEVRWFPADESLRETGMHQLLPPLVSLLRQEVKQWRERGYEGATRTSRSLLNWWFNTPHVFMRSDGTEEEFRYYFAQREAMETIIFLHDVAEVKDKFDLIRFDSTGAVSTGMFDENWLRFVVKMATGTGKTKVMSLVVAWSFYHKLYEPTSNLARNFLIIAPNIIVLDRLYNDFQGNKVFFQDPVLPDNGIDGRNWRDDFQLTLHVQDDVRITRPTGNIFLTNIHRVYPEDDIPASPHDENTMDYFLGPAPVASTTDSTVDLGMIVRDIDELVVLNDEAHHVHDSSLAWFRSIEHIHNKLVLKGRKLSLQLDVTATPKHQNGAIFVQTVCDYPLVEAITQNVVKHPVLPDVASRQRLIERQSPKYVERYADFIDLGVTEWRKAYAEHEKLGKKAVLFVMTDDTRNCDDVAEYLEGRYPEFKDAVLVIHTKKNGEISEASSAENQRRLRALRQAANEIDSDESPYKAVVSVMMLKEGWDVRNVTTIVGLRAYTAKAQILPEQTLGRGLRKMYGGDVEEYLSVVGTDAFMEFVESIQAEGVILERKPMGPGTGPKAPLVIEVDRNNEDKNIDALDVKVPLLAPRMLRDYKSLANLDLSKIKFQNIEYRDFPEQEHREIVFRSVTTGEIAHTTEFGPADDIHYGTAIGFFARTIMSELRLVSGYDELYGKIKSFVEHQLFGRSVDLALPNTIRNLSELDATRTVIESFKKAINELTVQDVGSADIRDWVRLQDTRPFVVKEQAYIVPKKSVFNRIVSDRSRFELTFSSFLDNCPDVQAHGKNFAAVDFVIDYAKADGNLADYRPDFLVRLSDGHVVVVETKGLVDVDVPLKMRRLRQWCEDANAAQDEIVYDFMYVAQDAFEKYKPSTFNEALGIFKEYK